MSHSSFSRSRAFSIPELLVSLAIISVIAGVIVYNQSQFNRSLLLENAAYDLAFKFRELQSKAINVQAAHIQNVSNPYEYGYGVYVAKNPIQFVLFYDKVTSTDNLNGYFNASHGDILEGSTISLSERFTITEVCAYSRVTPRAGWKCLDNGGQLQYLHFSFMRPYLQPEIYLQYLRNINGPSSDRRYDEQITKIYIEIKDSSLSEERYVVINSTGNIYVSDTPPTS